MFNEHVDSPSQRHQYTIGLLIYLHDTQIYVPKHR